MISLLTLLLVLVLSAVALSYLLSLAPIDERARNFIWFVVVILFVLYLIRGPHLISWAG